MTLHTTEGLREVDTSRYCCDGNCRQGRDCPEAFIRQENALTAAIRWTLPAIALWVVVAVALALITAGIAFAVGYVGRLLGVI